MLKGISQPLIFCGHLDILTLLPLDFEFTGHARQSRKIMRGS